MQVNPVLAAGVTRQRFASGETRHTKLNQPSREALTRFPFYQALIAAGFTTPVAQLRWKIYVRWRCIKDLEFRRAIWAMCKHDVAFFAVTFCWIFEPRPPRSLPYSPWIDQIDLLAWMDEAFPYRNFGNGKTRGLGLTWLCTVFFYHKLLFWPEAAIAVITKDKNLLDSTQGPNSLIGKFMYLHEHMPVWVRFKDDKTPLIIRSMEDHMLTNTLNKASIQGFVSTNTKVRSLRFTAIWADEFAFYGRDAQEWMVSSSGTTFCRFMISTWNSYTDMFHHVMYEDESSMLKTFSYWWDNYERWQGAYKIEHGRVTLIDKDYKHQPDYAFGQPDLLPEGTIRSPWVDAELSEPGADTQKTLRDLYGPEVCERDSSFFHPNTRKAVEVSETEPTQQGILDETKPQFVLIPTLKSEVRIWGDPRQKNTGPYTAGFDLAFGIGASYSVMQVIDAGGVQILEYGTNTSDVKIFAANAVKIARWLAGGESDGWVLFDFEANAYQARVFYDELVRLEYGNIHRSMKKTTSHFRADSGFQKHYHGTWNDDGNTANFKELERAIMSMDCMVKSKKVREEMRLFGKDPDKGGRPTFPNMSKHGHGDFTSALGIAWNRAKTSTSVENRVDQTAGSVEPSEPWLRSGRGAVFTFSDERLWSSKWR